MKNIIVTIAEILLGIALFALILSGDNSLKVKSESVFTKVANQVGSLKISPIPDVSDGSDGP